MTTSERRRTPRKTAHLLTSFRRIENGEVTLVGFVRTLDVSEEGAQLESPDAFVVGQMLELEFLLDNDQLINLEGKVVRVVPPGGAQDQYRIGVSFAHLTRDDRRLLGKQVKS